jgi:hypothetical protein
VNKAGPRRFVARARVGYFNIHRFLMPFRFSAVVKSR